MPATRSRTSTEQPEAANEDVKSSDTDQQNEEESVEKSATDRDADEENNENSTSTTFEDKEVEESEDNDNDNSNEVNDVKDANGDQSEEKVENGSVKRKSEVGEGDVAAVGNADSTDVVITKKAKLDANDEPTNEVEGSANSP